MSVRRWMQGVAVIVCGLAAVSPALAQQRPAPRSAQPLAPVKADPQEAVRYQIAVMESVLETAVQQGAQVMTRQWRAVAPDMLLMSGTARARGFRLDGYGVFFVVDVPAMRQSVVWTWRMLDREAGGTDVALQTIRELIKSVTDAAKRKDLEQAIRRLEIQVAPYSRTVDPNARGTQSGAAAVAQSGVAGGTAGVSGRAAAPAATASQAAAASAMAEIMTDPGEAYTEAVKNALVEAMLDYGQPLLVTPEESVTVAARDNSARVLGGDDSGDSVTIIIRIKGSDLQSFRAGKLTRDEVRKRVEIRQY